MVSNYYLVLKTPTDHNFNAEWLCFKLSSTGEVIELNSVLSDQENYIHIQPVLHNNTLPMIAYDPTLTSHSKLCYLQLDANNKLLRSHIMPFNYPNKLEYRLKLSEHLLNYQWKKAGTRHEYNFTTEELDFISRLKNFTPENKQAIETQRKHILENITEKIASHTDKIEKTKQLSQQLQQALKDEKNHQYNILVNMLYNIDEDDAVAFSAVVLALFELGKSVDQVFLPSLVAEFLATNARFGIEDIIQPAYSILRQLSDNNAEDKNSTAYKLSVFIARADKSSVYIVGENVYGEESLSIAGFERRTLSGNLLAQDIDDDPDVRLEAVSENHISITCDETNWENLYGFFKHNLLLALFDGKKETNILNDNQLPDFIENTIKQQSIDELELILNKMTAHSSCYRVNLFASALSDEQAINLLASPKFITYRWILLANKNITYQETPESQLIQWSKHHRPAYDAEVSSIVRLCQRGKFKAIKTKLYQAVCDYYFHHLNELQRISHKNDLESLAHEAEVHEW